ERGVPAAARARRGARPVVAVAGHDRRRRSVAGALPDAARDRGARRGAGRTRTRESHASERPRVLRRLRQSAQGGRDQRGADRPIAGGGARSTARAGAAGARAAGPVLGGALVAALVAARWETAVLALIVATLTAAFVGARMPGTTWWAGFAIGTAFALALN